MQANSQNDNNFDKTLRSVLKSYRQPVPENFVNRALKHIRQTEERQILARVIMQERFALASCIILVLVPVIMLLFFPHIVHIAAKEFNVLITKTCEIITADFYNDWGFTLILTFAFGFAVYLLMDLLTENN